MRVIHLLPALEQGGVESVVVALNRMLVRSGQESIVISRGGRLQRQVEADGGRHVTLELKSKNPLTAGWRAWRLRQQLKKLALPGATVVCAHSRVPAWLFWLANRRLGLKWITYAHGANRVSRYSEIMTRGDLTVVPSQFLAEYLKAHYPIADARLRVIGNPVEEDRYDPSRLDAAAMAEFRRQWGLDEQTPVIMSVGRLTPLKGFDNLIRIAAELKRRGFKFKLVIVGGAERRRQAYAESLRELVKSLGLEEVVVFAGSQAQVPECLALATVVVSGNVAKPESFGLTIVEAQLMNCAVIARRFGGAAELIEDGKSGLLVEDAEGFLPAIEKVLKGEWQPVADLRERTLRRFNAGRFAAETLAAYAEVQAASGGRK